MEALIVEDSTSEAASLQAVRYLVKGASRATRRGWEVGAVRRRRRPRTQSPPSSRALLHIRGSEQRSIASSQRASGCPCGA